MFRVFRVFRVFRLFRVFIGFRVQAPGVTDSMSGGSRV